MLWGALDFGESRADDPATETSSRAHSIVGPAELALAPGLLDTHRRIRWESLLFEWNRTSIRYVQPFETILWGDERTENLTENPPATTTFAVVPDHVSDAGRYVQQTAENLISGLRTAAAEVDGLMSSWRGIAATAYAGAWDETHRAALDVFEALADMAELLGVVVDRTAATDTASAGAYSSLSLPPI